MSERGDTGTLPGEGTCDAGIVRSTSADLPAGHCVDARRTDRDERGAATFKRGVSAINAL
jgi:hypothetical protein